MSDAGDSHPQLIRPLVRTTERLALVRERQGSGHQEVEHPHCEEHFLFTPHCAACIEAEKTQHAKVRATRVDGYPASKPNVKPPQSSRSFGFKDNLPQALIHEPTFAEHALDWFTRPSSQSDPVFDTIIDLFRES